MSEPQVGGSTPPASEVPGRNIDLGGGDRFLVEAHPHSPEGAFYSAMWPTDLSVRQVLERLRGLADLDASRLYGSGGGGQTHWCELDVDYSEAESTLTSEEQRVIAESLEELYTRFVPYATAAARLRDPGLTVRFMQLEWDNSALTCGDASSTMGAHVCVLADTYDRASLHALVLATGSSVAKARAGELLGLVESHAAGCWTAGPVLPPAPSALSGEARTAVPPVRPTRTRASADSADVRGAGGVAGP